MTPTIEHLRPRAATPEQVQALTERLTRSAPDLLEMLGLTQ